MAPLDIELIPAFRDNYIHMVRDPDRTALGIVDPGDAEPVIARLEREHLTPTHILITHHHPDHIGGMADLKARYPSATLVGPRSETARIPGLDVTVAEGDSVPFGSLSFEIIEVPGHTSGHIAFWSDDGRALFCGDTMFALGCGRLFEGTPAQMWHSLGKLARLPAETRVYCAHEYTQSNARFALTVDGDNPALVTRAREIDAARAQDRPTVPSTVGLERATNPFLRADQPALAHAVGLDGADPVAVFAEIRQRKDRF